MFPDLFADAAPGVVEDRVLIPRDGGVQLLQHDLHAAAAVHEPADVVHHGSLTVHTGALVRRPGQNIGISHYRIVFFKNNQYKSILKCTSIVVLPKTISLQEYPQREVILAVEFHGDDPVDNEISDYDSLKSRCEILHSVTERLPGADAGVGRVVGLSRGAAEEDAQSLMVDRVQTVELRRTTDT